MRNRGVHVLAHPYFYTFQALDSESENRYNRGIKNGRSVRY
nr:MAG TPA: hypothetical protein [Caudoviricetes sp.]